MGVGVGVQGGRARAQQGVCIHDLCSLYREGGVDTTFLGVGAEGLSLSLHVRLLPAWWYCTMKVTLQSVRWETYCFEDSIRVSLLWLQSRVLCPHLKVILQLFFFFTCKTFCCHSLLIDRTMIQPLCQFMKGLCFRSSSLQTKWDFLHWEERHHEFRLNIKARRKSLRLYSRVGHCWSTEH